MKSSFLKKVSIAIVLVLLGGSAALLLSGKATEYPDGTAGPSVLISIAAGENGSEIAQDLFKKGVIRASKTFYDLATKDPRALGISPGIHTIDSHITTVKALNQLLNPSRNSGLVTVIEGSTFSDVSALLKKAGTIGPVGAQTLPSLVKGSSLEGVLFPASYALAEKSSTRDAIAQMISTFNAKARTVGLSSGYRTYSAYDVLKIASLIQIEADPIDYAKAARVIYNRLAITMPLQLNSTVHYAMKSHGHITLTRNQTSFPSPYNTYLHTGLPPTPISNPGAAAISAALHPDTGEWLYFITVKPHDTRFTKSFDEFEGWVTLYNNNVANGLFK